MRDETRKRLEARLASDRWLVIKVGGLFVLLAILGDWGWTIPFGTSRPAGGIVRNMWTIVETGTLQHTMKLEVLLDDGRYAMAIATFRKWPETGSRIVLREETNVFGYHHYYWDGLTPDQPKAAP